MGAYLLPVITSRSSECSEEAAKQSLILGSQAILLGLRFLSLSLCFQLLALAAVLKDRYPFALVHLSDNVT